MKTFLDWLRFQASRDDEVGMFATAAVADQHFPWSFPRPESLRDYLRIIWDAQEDVLGSAEGAWEEYQASLAEAERWQPTPAPEDTDRIRDLRERLVCAALTGFTANRGMAGASDKHLAGYAVSVADATLAEMEKKP